MRPAAGDSQLVITPGAIRESTDSDREVLYWPTLGRRVALPPAMMRILGHFVVADSATAVIDRIAAGDPASAEVARRAIDSLADAGVLSAPEPVQPPLASRRTGLFGAPVTDLASALAADVDVVVLGVPHDHGASYRPGSRFGPEALRRASTSIYRIDDERRGVYDPERDRRLVEDLNLLDIGDLVGRLGDLGHDVLDATEETVAAVASSGAIPVILGGDHSITLRVVDGLTRAHPRIGVIHLDAHFDHGLVTTGPREAVHHGNFINWVAGNPKVEYVAQLGIRQLVPDPPEPSEKVHRWPGRGALELSPAELAASLPPGLVWHVSFDVDVLDPSVMPATGTLLPGGWSYRDAVDLICGLAEEVPIVGVDIVEFLPDVDETPGLTLAALLIRLIDSLHLAAPREVETLGGEASS